MKIHCKNKSSKNLIWKYILIIKIAFAYSLFIKIS